MIGIYGLLIFIAWFRLNGGGSMNFLLLNYDSINILVDLINYSGLQILIIINFKNNSLISLENLLSFWLKLSVNPGNCSYVPSNDDNILF